MPDINQAALVDLRLNAVALCNAGANSRAYIVLNKRKENENMPSTFEELLASLKPEHAALVNKHIEGLEAAKDQTIGTLQTKVSDLEKSVPTPPPAAAEEDILKALPEDVRKKVEAMQATIDAMVTKQAEDLAKNRFEKCKALPIEEEALKSVLKAASPAMVEVLEKAAAALEQGTHTAKGKETNSAFPAVSADAHYEVLEKAAQKIASETEGLTFEQAFTKAIEQNPDTYTKYVEGVK